MIYVISIDWLAIHCHFAPALKPLVSDDTDRQEQPQTWSPEDTPSGKDLFAGTFIWRYRQERFATRQFSELWRVSTPNVEGGWDEFAEIQAHPFSGILNRNSVIVRFVNRALYLPDFWERAEDLLRANEFEFKGITRIDICADFNQFKTMSAEELIAGFAAKKYRHVGQGVGALYFNHGILADKMTKKRAYGVNYTGLSFGTHGSDFRTYLYNKSFELLTQGDKPWIRDRWRNVGLDVQNVWRLEVSIKSAACKFKDRTTGRIVPIDKDAAADDDELGKIFHTFVRKKFAFVRNHPMISNISREPRLELFDRHPIYDHRTIRNISAGKRFEKMFIKALYLLGDLYRGQDIHDESLTAQSLAFDIAHSTDLSRWMSEKIPTWEKPTHK